MYGTNAGASSLGILWGRGTLLTKPRRYKPDSTWYFLTQYAVTGPWLFRKASTASASMLARVASPTALQNDPSRASSDLNRCPKARLCERCMEISVDRFIAASPDRVRPLGAGQLDRSWYSPGSNWRCDDRDDRQFVSGKTPMKGDDSHRRDADNAPRVATG